MYPPPRKKPFVLTPPIFYPNPADSFLKKNPYMCQFQYHSPHPKTPKKFTRGDLFRCTFPRKSIEKTTIQYASKVYCYETLMREKHVSPPPIPQKPSSYPPIFYPKPPIPFFLKENTPICTSSNTIPLPPFFVEGIFSDPLFPRKKTIEKNKNK